MADSSVKDRSFGSGSGNFLTCLIAAICLVVLLCLLFRPLWETNDDVAMSMVAHGYGIAARGSPNLIFSNVLWGYLVRSIPSVDGVLGYSLATLGVLALVGAVALYGLVRAGAGYVVAAALAALLLVRPILFPQFTINAGLLAVGGVICWHLAARDGNKLMLAMGCVLAFCSYLVRGEEFLLVLLVALPLLPWRFLGTRQAPRIAVSVLVLAIALAAFLDHLAYRGADWGAFEALNSARAPLTDFGVAPRLKQRRDILQKHGYSTNDIDLVGRWFFVDPNIADPKALRAMVDELGPSFSNEHDLSNAMDNAVLGVEALWKPRLVTPLLVALLLLACRPSWRVAASWLLCAIAVALLGFLGRPGILRVYVPVVALLLIAPLLLGRVAGWRRRLVSGAVLVAAAFNVYAVCSESRFRQADAEQARRALAGFPSYPVVIWGGVFPFEKVYPVLGASPAAMSYRLYGLGVFTWAPFSIPYAEHEAGWDMIDRLRDKGGLPIVVNDAWIGNLKTYCSDRLQGRLVVVSSEHFGRVNMSRLRCGAAL